MTDSFDYSELVHPVSPDDESVEPEPQSDTSVFEALQVYHAAEAAMRRRTGTAMKLGGNDLLALRFLLDNQAAGRITASKDVTRYLGISSASTTVLLHRLERGGFIERRPSRTDRRSIEIVPTPSAEGDTGPLLAVAQNQIADASKSLTPDEARIITRFLTQMRKTVDQIG